VFASDQLPKINTVNACFIVNYSPVSKSSSGHWIAFGNLNSGSPAWYFDSYGFPPDHDDDVLHDKTNFTDYIIKNSSSGTYNYNKFDYQAYEKEGLPPQDECGEWSASAIVQNWGATQGDSPFWNKLKSMPSGYQRDSWIKQYVGIRK